MVSLEGAIFTMGNGEGGLLGQGKLETCHTPSKIRNLENVKIVTVESGAFNTLSLSKDGHLFSWGRGDGGQLGIDVSVMKTRLASFGVDSTDFICIAPEVIAFPDMNLKFIQIACGEAHCLALTTTNQVYGWGANNNGQLGNGECADDHDPGSGTRLTTKCEPIQLTALSNKQIIRISAAGAFSSFITRNGEVLMCGNDNKG